ncbi:universal stress protein [Streptomyces griseoincarnatus]
MAWRRPAPEGTLEGERTRRAGPDGGVRARRRTGDGNPWARRLHGMLLGSVDHGVLRHAHCPVLAVPVWDRTGTRRGDRVPARAATASVPLTPDAVRPSAPPTPCPSRTPRRPLPPGRAGGCG